jgi:large subunit ribosomal protein L19
MRVTYLVYLLEVMESLVQKISKKYMKPAIIAVKSGDTVRVHQKIKEGAKERVQIFQGVVIRVDRKNSVTARIAVWRLTGGIGVEKTFLMHSPNVVKIEVTKRSKVRRNYLSYMRDLTGKSARLTQQDADLTALNAINDEPVAEQPAVEEPAAE